MGKMTGIGKDIFWALESAFLNGGAQIDGGDIHQPFNPIEGSIAIPKPVNENEEVITSESLEPNEDLSYDIRKEVGTGAFPNDKGTIYHDPFLFLALVPTHKETSGIWAGGAMRAEISTIVADVPGSIDDGDYITLTGISAANVATNYYAWFDKVGNESGDPAPASKTKITIDISASVTTQDVSDAIAAAITAVSQFGAVNGSTTTTTITNVYKGNVTDIADVDSGLAVAVTTQGISPGVIIGNMTAIDDISSIMVQYKYQDKAASEIIQRCLNGVMANSYSLMFKTGVDGILREKAELIVADVNPNTQAFVPNASFDDGMWADWAKSTNYPSADIRVYWDDSHAAELSEFEIEEGVFRVVMPKEYEFFSDSLKAQDFDLKNREYIAEITGWLFGDALILEAEKTFATKLKQDIRLQWDITANEEKHLTFTNAYLKAIDSYDMPAASEAKKITLTFRGLGTVQFEGNFDNLADPTGRIDLSP